MLYCCFATYWLVLKYPIFEKSLKTRRSTPEITKIHQGKKCMRTMPHTPFLRAYAHSPYPGRAGLLFADVLAHTDRALSPFLSYYFSAFCLFKDNKSAAPRSSDCIHEYSPYISRYTYTNSSTSTSTCTCTHQSYNRSQINARALLHSNHNLFCQHFRSSSSSLASIFSLFPKCCLFP